MAGVGVGVGVVVGVGVGVGVVVVVGVGVVVAVGVAVAVAVAVVMPQPQRVPDNGPMERWTIRVPDRLRAYITDTAKKKKMAIGEYLDEAFGGPKHGAWNDKDQP